MKSAVKTVSFTIDELRNMLAVTLKSGDTRAADEVISKKISDKAERLARQREKRRQRAEQKKAEVKKSEVKKSDVSESCPNELTISLGRNLATCIIWLYNRRNHLKNNIGCLLNEMYRNSNHPAIKSIESALDTLIDLSEQAIVPAHQYLNLSNAVRPKSAPLTL